MHINRLTVGGSARTDPLKELTALPQYVEYIPQQASRGGPSGKGKGEMDSHNFQTCMAAPLPASPISQTDARTNDTTRFNIGLHCMLLSPRHEIMHVQLFTMLHYRTGALTSNKAPAYKSNTVQTKNAS